MTKHTPGPWTFREEWGATAEEQARGDPLRLCFLSINAENETIATTFCNANVANARLIAAAPEMAETIRFALECLDKDGPASAAAVLNTKGRAAIAKATGGSP